MKEEKNYFSNFLAATSFVGSISSIISLNLDSEKHPFLKFVETEQVSNGVIALGAFIFIGLIVLYSSLNDKTHARYHQKLMNRISELEEEKNNVASENKQTAELNDTIEKKNKDIRDLNNEIQTALKSLSRFDGLAEELMGIFKSGNELEFYQIRGKIDKSYSDGEINRALNGLGDKITSIQSSKYGSSKYVINNA